MQLNKLTNVDIKNKITRTYRVTEKNTNRERRTKKTKTSRSRAVRACV